MSGSSERQVAVVLASIDSSATIDLSVAGFLREVGDRGSVIVVDASRDDSAARVEGISPRLRVIRRPSGSLAPELWRDGLNSCDAALVSFSTCQMSPRHGWLPAMERTLDASDCSGVGGPIAPSRGLNAIDQALYLLRFASYFPPLPNSDRFDPPGDNALYRRDRLIGLEDSWRDGFWELEVHRHMRSRGDRLGSANHATVEFLGGAKLTSSLRHRMAHARHFGAGGRAGRTLAQRLIRSASFPAVPPILMARIATRLRDRHEPIGPWLRSIPALTMYLSAWSLGEAAGGLIGPGRRRLST